MPLELINTIAGLLTVTIVAATAIAALIQLRHLRAGNQIHALISVDEKLGGREFSDALRVVYSGLEAALVDPAFRDYEIAVFRRLPPPRVDQRYVDMHDALVLVGNTFELMGLLVRNRIVDPGLFVDNYCGIALAAWKLLLTHTALGREVGDNAIWENFEYLAVLSQDWMRTHPSSYPKGVRRFEMHNPWPVPSASVTRGS